MPARLPRSYKPEHIQANPLMTDPARINQFIKTATRSQDGSEIRSTYAEWSDSYDSDLERFGYLAPATAVAQLSALLPDRQALIYDAGCGTGLAGVALAKAGFEQLHGADFSAEMLAQARATGLYQQLELADYSAPVAVPGQTYDAVISVGVYCAGFRPHFLAEMARILRPGGILQFTCRPHYYEGEVDQDMPAMVQAGIWTDLQVDKLPYMAGQNADAYYIAARKT